MPLSRGLASLMKVPVRHYARDNEDDYGNRTYANVATVYCYIDSSSDVYGEGVDGARLKTTPNSTVTVYANSVSITVGDRMEFPSASNVSEYDGKNREVIDVKTYRDKNGLGLMQEVVTETE